MRAQYHARLIECLEAEFPMFRQAVGADAFADFAVEYLKQYPSHSHTLANLGATFPRFLEETNPSATSDSLTAGWPEFLIDLALVERTFSEVFDGPGIEERQTISVDELRAIDSQSWPQARLTPAPCLRLLALRFPLNDYYTTSQTGPGAAPAQECQFVAGRNQARLHRATLRLDAGAICRFGRPEKRPDDRPGTCRRGEGVSRIDRVARRRRAPVV